MNFGTELPFTKEILLEHTGDEQRFSPSRGMVRITHIAFITEEPEVELVLMVSAQPVDNGWNMPRQTRHVPLSSTHLSVLWPNLLALPAHITTDQYIDIKGPRGVVILAGAFYGTTP